MACPRASALRCSWIRGPGGETPVNTRPRDDTATGNAGRSHLRASHADREQVIGTLKAAFVQGMVGKDEFDLRVSQAFASRTCADLAALTADSPAGRSGGKLTRGPGPGAGGQASQRLASVGPEGQLRPARDHPRHTAEAAPSRRPRPLLPVWRARISMPGVR